MQDLNCVNPTANMNFYRWEDDGLIIVIWWLRVANGVARANPFHARLSGMETGLRYCGLVVLRHAGEKRSTTGAAEEFHVASVMILRR